MKRNEIYQGDCREVLATWPENCVDAVVTDPPYELGFMGKKWDSSGVSYDVNTWAAVLRVLKPGGHMLAFGGTRTYHRIACAIEDAGFEIRDQMQWLYGSGFPKSLDVSKAIDKAAGVKRKTIGPDRRRLIGGTGTGTTNHGRGGVKYGVDKASTPSTKSAKEWDGWGTALKPANEPICLARKPLSKKTVAANVLRWGTGALNIDACRIDSKGAKLDGGSTVGSHGAHEGWRRPWMENPETNKAAAERAKKRVQEAEVKGRWPSNVLLDEISAAQLDRMSGPRKAGGSLSGQEPSRSGGPGTVAYGEFKERREWDSYGDSGGASRFFYTAKAGRAERNEGLEGMPKQEKPLMGEFGINPGRTTPKSSSTPRENFHPTVKPIRVIQYLIRLILPPGGVVLDPFLGSGTLMKAARGLGVDWVGVELNPEYVKIAKGRISGELF